MNGGGDSITELIVVRHAESELNKRKIMQGHLDPPLSQLGERQAEAVAKRLRTYRLAALYSSDLQRAKQTAVAIASETGLTVQYDHRLRERHLGVLQGKTWEEAKKKHPEVAESIIRDDPHYVIPGGESRQQVMDRVIPFMQEMVSRYPGQRVGVVTHGGIVYLMLYYALQIPLTLHLNLQRPNAGLFVFVHDDQTWSLQCWGDTCHLDGLAVRASLG